MEKADSGNKQSVTIPMVFLTSKYTKYLQIICIIHSHITESIPAVLESRSAEGLLMT